MAKSRLTTRDSSGRAILKSYAIDARMAAVRKLAEYEEAEEQKSKVSTKKRNQSVQANAAQEYTEVVGE